MNSATLLSKADRVLVSDAQIRGNRWIWADLRRFATLTRCYRGQHRQQASSTIFYCFPCLLANLIGQIRRHAPRLGIQVNIYAAGKYEVQVNVLWWGYTGGQSSPKNIANPSGEFLRAGVGWDVGQHGVAAQLGVRRERQRASIAATAAGLQQLLQQLQWTQPVCSIVCNPWIELHQ